MMVAAARAASARPSRAERMMHPGARQQAPAAFFSVIRRTHGRNALAAVVVSGWLVEDSDAPLLILEEGGGGSGYSTWLHQ